MDFTLNKNAAFIDFDTHYCTSSSQLLNSQPFKTVLQSFIHKAANKQNQWFVNLFDMSALHLDSFIDELLRVFKLLLVMELEDIDSILTKDCDSLLTLVEEMYNYWRRFERYSLLSHKNRIGGIASINFTTALSSFNNLCISVYRSISETLRGHKNQVYRQLAAGSNAGLILDRTTSKIPEEYGALRSIKFIESVLLYAPFIVYPENTKRDGTFKELGANPLHNLSLDPNSWFCYPIKVGNLSAFVFFHTDYTNIGVSLANLFEPLSKDEYMNKKPDIIYVYGYDCLQTGFYHDQKNDIYIGMAAKGREITYFGYMKKMLLTLHNLSKINQGQLPIHGAFVSILFKGGLRKNICLMGDSGAGKSETLEALRSLADENIIDMTVVFDDMGVFSIENNRIIAYGTEIGAFVRLDDLDIGYAYKEISRAIFINPDKANARTIIPVSTYNQIIRGVPLDMFLYANNYTDEIGIDFYGDTEQAKKVFVEGMRRAKGTTQESGLVSTFFANPFGPLQRTEQTAKLIDTYFDLMFKSGVKVGQIYTRLALENTAGNSPLPSSKVLLKYLLS